MENVSVAFRVKYFTVTVEVPADKLIVVFGRFDIKELEKHFFRLYAKEPNIESKRNYRSCYMICKQARAHYGALKACSNNSFGIQFTIAFKTMEQVSDFLEDFKKSAKITPQQ